MEYKWAHEHESVLAEWADKSNCYKWLHTKCNEKFHSLHIWYTIPVIVMSTLTGTANFAQNQIPVNFRNYATMLIGTINIFAGIITTIQQFLKINELNESHRVASIGWDKFYRRLKIELSKNPLERQPILEFFNSASDEYDRLMATSPMIENDILVLFNKTFGNTFTSDFSKPEICNSLISVRSTIYKKSDIDKKDQIMKDLVGDIMITQTEKQTTKHKLIKEFYDKFQQELKRVPTEHELIDNLILDPSVHDLSITEDMIHAYLDEL
jgi:hypothetical protein